MSQATALSLSTFVFNTVNLLEELEAITIQADNDTVDASGIADEFEYHLAVKQGQQIEITAQMLNSSSAKGTNLDVSAWNPDGTDFLADLRSGKLSISCTTKERSGIAAAYKVPIPTKRTAEITCTKIVATNASRLKTLLTGSLSSFEASASISFGTETFTAPMVISNAKHTAQKADIQMEDMTYKLQGTPTAPSSDGSILYAALLGTAIASLSTNTGANTYSGSSFLITKLEFTFEDAALIKQQITLMSQGAMTVA